MTRNEVTRTTLIALLTLNATLFPVMTRADNWRIEFELPPVELHENRTVEMIERLLGNDLEDALFASLNSRNDTRSIQLEGEVEGPHLARIPGDGLPLPHELPALRQVDQ